MIRESAYGGNQLLTKRNHVNSMYMNKIGRVRCRATHLNSARAKTRQRWHGHKLYTNSKLHIRDLRRYHMQKAHKIPSTIIINSTCCNNSKKYHVEFKINVSGTINILSSVYYILKRYHLN